jgi:hypothetical protein
VGVEDHGDGDDVLKIIIFEMKKKETEFTILNFNNVAIIKKVLKFRLKVSSKNIKCIQNKGRLLD